MTINPTLIQPMVAFGCGLSILVAPRLLNVIVAFYLMFVGLNVLWPDLLAISGLAGTGGRTAWIDPPR
jgi:hypothetical protein